MMFKNYMSQLTETIDNRNCIDKGCTRKLPPGQKAKHYRQREHHMTCRCTTTMPTNFAIRVVAADVAMTLRNISSTSVTDSTFPNDEDGEVIEEESSGLRSKNQWKKQQHINISPCYTRNNIICHG